MSISVSVCHYYTWKWLILVTGLTSNSEVFQYLMVRPTLGDATNGVFDAGETLEAGFARILCMSRLWEVGKGLARAIV